MNIIVHMPETESGRKELARRVAAVHVMAVSYQLENANCSKVEKIKLIRTVQDSLP